MLIFKVPAIIDDYEYDYLIINELTKDLQTVSELYVSIFQFSAKLIDI